MTDRLRAEGADRHRRGKDQRAREESDELKNAGRSQEELEAAESIVAPEPTATAEMRIIVIGGFSPALSPANYDFYTGTVDTTYLALPADLTVRFGIVKQDHFGGMSVEGTINGFPVGVGSDLVNKWVADRDWHPKNGGAGHWGNKEWFGAEGGNVLYCAGKQKP